MVYIWFGITVLFGIHDMAGFAIIWNLLAVFMLYVVAAHAGLRENVEIWERFIFEEMDNQIIYILTREQSKT